MKVLFQGDSITDMGRNRDDIHEMGNGYPLYASKLLKEKYPDAEFINLGISGNRTRDLVERWDTDCIEIQPDLVSILIGINDTWRAFDSNDPTDNETFERNYRNILERTKKETNAKILILEPFLTEADPNKACFRPDLDPKILIVRKLAREYADAFIPLDGLIAAGCVGKDGHEPSFYAPDSVHPSPEGASYIAKYYADAAEKLI